MTNSPAASPQAELTPPAPPAAPKVLDGPLLPPIGPRPRRGLIRAVAGQAVSARVAKAAAVHAQGKPALRRANLGFLFSHPAHFIALGAGSGMSPITPGTAGTLWAWAAFLLIDPFLGDLGWLLTIALSFLVGTWACLRTAQHLGQLDPSNVVIDEIVAFWLVLWLCAPMGLFGQTVAFLLFRFFDAAKPGPVGWVESRYKGQGWFGAFGIMIDDIAAALCTVLVIALWYGLFIWVIGGISFGP